MWLQLLKAVQFEVNHDLIDPCYWGPAQIFSTQFIDLLTYWRYLRSVDEQLISLFFFFNCTTNTNIVHAVEGWETYYQLFINCFLLKRNILQHPEKHYPSRERDFTVHWGAAVRWLKVHYLSLVIPWMSYAKLVVFHLVINWSSRATFQHALFFSPQSSPIIKDKFPISLWESN